MRPRLSLEDVLLDTQQHQQLVHLFENDCIRLHNWGRQLLSAVSELTAAQKKVGEKMKVLSEVLDAYSTQNFLLEDPNINANAMTQKVSRTLQEACGWVEAIHQQLETCVQHPLNKANRDLERLCGEESNKYHFAKEEFLDAEDRFLRCSRKENPAKFEDLNQTVYSTKLKYHRAGLGYCSALNSMQDSRYILMLEPALSVLYILKSFFAAGNDTLHTADLNQFFNDSSQTMMTVVSEAHQVLAKQAEVLLTLDAIQQSEQDYYLGEPRSAEPVTVGPLKQGFLRWRMKSGIFGHNWEKGWAFFTGSLLMWHKSVEIGGCPIMDLSIDEVRIEESSEHDRRFVFSLYQKGHDKMFFQASNTRDMREWMDTIRVISAESLDPSRQQPKVCFATEPIQFDLLSIGHLPEGFTADEADAENQFDVDYLGSIELHVERTGDDVIQEAIDTVIASREIYKIDDKLRLKLMLCGSRVIIKDADNQLRAFFDFNQILCWMVSRRNPFIFGMLSVAKDAEKNSYMCSAFEVKDRSAGEVCTALAVSTAQAFSKAQAEAEERKSREDHANAAPQQQQVNTQSKEVPATESSVGKASEVKKSKSPSPATKAEKVTVPAKKEEKSKTPPKVAEQANAAESQELPQLGEATTSTGSTAPEKEQSPQTTEVKQQNSQSVETPVMTDDTLKKEKK